ncbi:MAG TPA: hypothetical protein VHT51_16505 [Micropepsaceae bacterium]|jgi:hypothetical protein|nr:hypothetical protein [Micropepsaceae bacterium]
MLTPKQIRDEMLRIAREHLGREEVKDVLVEDDVDHFGEASLRITIVLNSKRKMNWSGSLLGRISIEALEYLLKNGDQRYPYTHYATDKELSSLSKAK